MANGTYDIKFGIKSDIIIDVIIVETIKKMEKKVLSASDNKDMSNSDGFICL
jgi:hypothetical protein